MEQIIDDVLYNTETDDVIAAIEKKSSNFDLYAWGEVLQRNASGGFYLFCHGAPFSRYGKTPTSKNVFAGGGQIHPLSLEDAKEWASHYLEKEEFASVFPEQLHL